MPRNGRPQKLSTHKKYNTIESISVGRLQYKIGDFCYVRPDRSAEPYYIGCIMGFKQETKSNKVRVQMGWYLRPHDKDVASLRKRKIKDSRYVFATMHTDTVPVRLIMDHCRVQHEDSIANLQEYIHQPDSFYYNQLYDKYNRKFYDAVPLAQVKALSSEVMERLSRYQFIVVDDGTKEYYICDRTCNYCREQCSIEKGLECSRCRKTYHMKCVGASTRPRVGFAWECPGCTLERDIAQGMYQAEDTYVQDLQSKIFKRKRSSTVYYRKSVKPTASNGWPFRYYHENLPLGGRHYDADFDKGLPRAFTRLGKKFQVPFIPACRPKSDLADEDDAEAAYFASLEPSSKPSKKKISAPSNSSNLKKIPVPESRTAEPCKRSVRGSAAELVLDLPHSKLTDAQIDAYTASACDVYSKDAINTDVLNFILATLAECSYDTERALEKVRNASLLKAGVRSWSEEDVKLFEDEVFKRNYDIASFKRDFVDKTLGDIANFFFVWKKSDRKRILKEKFQQFALPSLEKVRDGAISTKEHNPEAGLCYSKDVESSDSDSSDSESESAQDPLADRIKDCTLCCSKPDSKLQTVVMVWGTSYLQYKHEVLCEQCLDYFKRYGLAVPLEELVKRNLKKRPLEASKLPTAMSRTTPIPVNSRRSSTRQSRKSL